MADSIDGVNLIDVEASQGLDLFNPTDSGTMRSRVDGETEYQKVLLNLSRTQTLPSNFSLLTAFSGQYSADKLLGAEQFSVGGASFGGAYDGAEISGDKGIAGRVELRYSDGTALDYFKWYQLYGYYDIGRIWSNTQTPDNPSLASAGLGVRTMVSPSVYTYVEVGLPLTKDVGVEQNRDPRVFFSVNASF